MPAQARDQASKPDSDRRSPAAWLLKARVLHERIRPRRLKFVYSVFCMRFDLDRLHELNACWWFGLNKPRLASLYLKDYGPHDGSDLAGWLRAELASQGITADGQLILQTFPRILGYAFNPVSFWFCHAADGRLLALLAEVNNTFGDRHSYLLVADDGQGITHDSRLVCRKTFHVSPFLTVQGDYTFRLRETPLTSFVSINLADDTGLILRTSIGGHLEPLQTGNFLRAFARQPLITFSVITRIHWQALRLWLRKVPFYGARPPRNESCASDSSIPLPDKDPS